MVRSWKDHAEQISDISTIKTASQFFTECALSLNRRGGINDTTITEPRPLTSVNSVATSRALGDIMDNLIPNSKALSGEKPRPTNMYPAQSNTLFESKFVSNTNIAWLDSNFEGCSALLKVVARCSLKNKLSEDTFNLMISDFWEINTKLKMLTPIKGLEKRLPSVKLDYFDLDDDHYNDLLGISSKPKPQLFLTKIGQMPILDGGNQSNNIDQVGPQAVAGGTKRGVAGTREVMLTMDQVAQVDVILKDVDNNSLTQIGKDAANIIIKMQNDTKLIVPAKNCITSSLLAGFISYCEVFLLEPQYLKIKEKPGKYRSRCIYHFSNVTVKHPIYLKIYASLVKFLKGCVKAMRVFNVDADFMLASYDDVEKNLQIAFTSIFSSQNESCIPEVEAHIEAAFDIKLDQIGGFKSEQHAARVKGQSKGKMQLDDISNNSVDEDRVLNSEDIDKMDEESGMNGGDLTELTADNIEHEDFEFLVNCASAKKLRFSAISDIVATAVFYNPEAFISFSQALTTNSAASDGLMCLISAIIKSDIFDLVMLGALKNTLYTPVTLAHMYAFWVYVIGKSDFDLRGLQLSGFFQSLPMTAKNLQSATPNANFIADFARQISNGHLEKIYMPFQNSDIFTRANKKAAESLIYAPHKNFLYTAELFVKCICDMPTTAKLDSDYGRGIIEAIQNLPASTPRPSDTDMLVYISSDKRFQTAKPTRGILSLGSGQKTIKVYSIYSKVGYSYNAIYRVCGGVNPEMLSSGNKQSK